MKRFFQRLENSSNSQRNEYQRETLGGPSGGPGSHSSGGSFIGKTFTLGQYHCTVEEIIAEGGFALVFLVKAQSSLGRFALKRLHVNNEQDLANCKREIEIAKKLGSHKNIVQLVESSINYCGNGVYEILMLMQYCKGHLLQLLNDRLKDGLPEADVVKILCNLCEAIAKMHHNDPPIIHRDLKVENILIAEGGTYLLCDFGSATTKVLALDSSASSASAMAIEEEIKRYTTLAYRSPEMVDVYSGKPITTKADIWALGCLLYKLCFFTLPFGESTLAIQNASLTIPDAHVERYSTKLLQLIAYMLTPDPNERPDIYQVSALAFQLADQKSPVPNLTVTKPVLVPAWTDLRIPPTESLARDTRKVSTVSQSSAGGGGGGIGAATAVTSLTHNSQSSNNLEAHLASSGSVSGGLTTSVVPRQRPKGTLNLNSVLPTSPLPFNHSTQRATTPSDIPNISSSSNNSANTAQATNKQSIAAPPTTLSTSASHGANLSAKAIQPDDDDEDDVDWSKKKNRNRSAQQQQPQPQTNSSSNSQLYGDFASKNPFLDSSMQPPVTTSAPAPLPQPPPSRRHSQTPPGVTSKTSPPGRRSNNTIGPALTSHHRRNVSDTSAFANSKNINVGSAAAAAAGMIATFNQLQAPTQQPQQATRVRSLNPFDDVNGDSNSYEDQLFGHEFDKIRQENNNSHSMVITSAAPRHHHQPPSSVQLIGSNSHHHLHHSQQDPFEAAPFDSDRLKRYFSKQGSLESSAIPSSACTFEPITEQQSPEANAKPYLINVNSTGCSGGGGSQQSSANVLSKPHSTVITIGANNDFVIHGNTSAANATQQPQSLSASSSSAFISVGNTTSGQQQLSEPMAQLSLNTTNQSISSSSQGQVTTLVQDANYLPLYSSDTADDSENSSDESSDSDVDSDNPLDHGRSGLTNNNTTDHHSINNQDEEEEAIDGGLVALQEVDLMKPLVVDEEEDYDDDGDNEVDDELDDEFGSESSIGSASDLQQTSDSESANSSSDEDDDYLNQTGEHELDDVPSTDSSQDSNSLKSSEDRKPSQPDDNDNGFEFINYDSNGNDMMKDGGSWFKPVTSNSALFTGASNSISRIQISNSANSARKLRNEEGEVSPRHNINKISMTPLVVDADDGTSVGEVLSITSSVNSSSTTATTTRNNTGNDNTSASIDHLIGHIEGSRPLLEDDDDVDEESGSAVANATDPSLVKPFIEIDKEIEYVPNANNANSAAIEDSTDMFSSMTSSINSVVMMHSEPTTYRQPKDLLTDEPSPTRSTDFEALSLQQIVDETEENRRLDEEVAISLNSQVILDKLTNKDLFGCIPFNDKELLNKSIIEQSTKPSISAKPNFTNQSSKGFENSFTDAVETTQKVTPMPNAPNAKQMPETTSKARTEPVVGSSCAQVAKNPIDLFGLQPFNAVTSAKAAAVGSVPPVSTAQSTTAKSDSARVTSATAGQTVRISGPPPALQIITLNPVNHQASQPPSTAIAVTSSSVTSTILKAPPPVVSVASSSTVLSASTPLSTTKSVLLSASSSATTTVSSSSSSTNPSSKPISTSSPGMIQSTAAQQQKPTVTKTETAAAAASATSKILSLPPVTSIKSGGLLQKSNSKLKSKVAKKYEVDESDDEVDGLLDLNEDESEMIMVDNVASGSASKKDKKDKKKDKKEKVDKKSKEKDKSKDKDKLKDKEKLKEEKTKEKEKTKEEKKKEKKEKVKSEKSKEKPEKEKKEKIKEPKKSKEEKEKEKLERKAEKEKEKEEKKKSKEKESKSAKEETSSKSASSVVSGLIASTPLKKDSKDKKESKESKKESKGKVKVPKHQAFANMSFEDEPAVASTTSTTTHVNASCQPVTSSGEGSNAFHSANKPTTSNTNTVTITRC